MFDQYQVVLHGKRFKCRCQCLTVTAHSVMCELSDCSNILRKLVYCTFMTLETLPTGFGPRNQDKNKNSGALCTCKFSPNSLNTTCSWGSMHHVCIPCSGGNHLVWMCMFQLTLKRVNTTHSCASCQFGLLCQLVHVVREREGERNARENADSPTRAICLLGSHPGMSGLHPVWLIVSRTTTVGENSSPSHVIYRKWSGLLPLCEGEKTHGGRVTRIFFPQAVSQCCLTHTETDSHLNRRRLNLFIYLFILRMCR